MKATKQQRELLDKTFQSLISDFHNELVFFKNNLVNNTLVNEEVQFDHDYEQFGREAFIFKLEQFIAEDKLLKEAKNLTNDKYQ